MTRIAAFALLSLSLSALPAYATEPAEKNVVAANADVEKAVTTAPLDVKSAMTPAEWLAANRRPRALNGLYASFAALQMFDVYSTRHAIAGGAQEANPAMTSAVGNPALFWTVKAAATVGPMLAAERLWKKNKVAAIAVMAVSNGVMAAVAAHNASVIRSQR